MANAPPHYKDLEEDETKLLDTLEDQYGNHGIFYYIKTGIVLLVGSVGFLMMFIICIGIPPAMITMGILYLRSCPVQPYIPIYLVVGGIFSLSSVILGLVVRMRIPRDNPHIKKVDMIILAISNLIHCFTIAWFIAGCTWVYGIYEPSYTSSSLNNYCDKAVYLFSFWLLNSVFIVLGTLLLLGLFMLITSLFMKIDT